MMIPIPIPISIPTEGSRARNSHGRSSRVTPYIDHLKFPSFHVNGLVVHRGRIRGDYGQGGGSVVFEAEFAEAG